MNTQEVKTKLGQLVGHDILLTKQEDGDIDQTILSLDNDKTPLPHQRYDIPLTAEMHIREYGNRTVLIETERAKYAIVRQ